jgi:ABC-type phosphate/phosphonate transport system substrate-binding protein
MKVSVPLPSKKKASGRTPAIPKMTKLFDEKTAKEIDASVKTDVDNFFAKVKAKSEEKRNPEKLYFFVRPEVLRQRVDAHQKKLRDAHKDSPLSDNDRTLTKSIEEAKKKEKRAWKGVS